MCAPDPNAGARMRARQDHARKQLAFEGARVKYHNKEISASKATDRNIIGISRLQGQAMRQALYVAGQAQKGTEAIAIQRGALGKHLDTGKYNEWSSRTAGRNDALALMRQQASIEASLDNTFREKMASIQTGIGRQYQVNRAKIKTDLGLPPNPSTVLTFMPHKDKRGQFINSIKLGLEIASMAAGIGSTKVGSKTIAQSMGIAQ